MTPDELLAIARAATPGDPDVWADADVIDRYNAAFRPARVIALLEFVQAWDAHQNFENYSEDMDVFEAIDKADKLVAEIFAKRRALDEA